MSPKVAGVDLSDVDAARDVLEGVIEETPSLHSRWLTTRVGTPVYLKCENLQRAGSFKIRGGYLRISRLSEDERASGVVAASAGNHAQGVGDQRGAFLGAALFQHGAARHHDIAAAAVHLEDLEQLRLVHQRADIAHRAHVNLRTGQEGHGAVQVDGEAALDAAEDHAGDAGLVVEGLFKLDPAFLAAGLVSERTASPSAFSTRSR